MNRLLIILFFFSHSSFAQSTDFLLVQKNGRTIGSYYAGNHITFTTVNDATIDGDITAIKNDTIYLLQFVIQQIPTNLGVYMLDTVNSYRFQYHYNQIKKIEIPGRHFDVSASGASLLGGGAILAIASGVVYLADNKNFSPALFIAGVSLATIGYFMSKAGARGMQIGKRYQLVYVNVADIKR